MGTGADLHTLRDFAIALLIGALVGIDRERRKPDAGASAVPGVRTFMLLALLGAVGGWLSREHGTPWLLIATVAGVAGVIIAGYLLQGRANPEALGVTTELAGLAVCLLGALTVLGQSPLAVALAIAISTLLAFKQPIHGLVRRLDKDDLYAGLKLLVATFIVLPVLPDKAVDPWGAINPYKLWLLVILISSLSLVGYVATRWLGPERGLAVTGLTGGLVSSTAVTLTFAKRSREEAARADLGGPLAIGILLAWGVMFVRMIVEVAVVNAGLLGKVLVPFAAMALAAAGLAGFFHLRAGKTGAAAVHGPDVPLRNPFSLRSALKFALFFTLVLLLVKLIEHYAPGRGLYLVAGLAGTTDVDAITLSLAAHARATGEDLLAVRAITLAALSNTVVKAVLVAALGSPALRGRTLLATAILVGCGAVGMAFV